MNTLEVCLATWILKHISVGEDAIGSYLVNTLEVCLATWIPKHICVGEDAVGSYLVNIHAPTFAMTNVETVR